MKNIAVILSAGKGSRMGMDLPKQFYKVAGKSIIEHTIDVFESNPNINEIYVVINSHYKQLMQDICQNNSWTKLTKIIDGGKERYNSSINAINACQEECNIIFHDSVRPLVSNRIIDDLIEKLKDFEAVNVAIAMTDSVIEAKDNLVQNVVDRSKLLRVQTPQGFRLSTIRNAYSIAMQDYNFTTTDDCGVVHKYLPDKPIYIVQGEEQNIKITYQENLITLENLLQGKIKTN